MTPLVYREQEPRWHDRCGTVSFRYADGECKLCSRTRKANRYKGKVPRVQRWETDQYIATLRIEMK